MKCRLIISLIGMLACAMVSAATASFSLGTGIIVEQDMPNAWVTLPNGEIAAVELHSGALRWQGPARGYPLSLTGSKLLALMEPTEAGRLTLALLDQQTGDIEKFFYASMPDGVYASMSPMLGQRFEVFAQTNQDVVTLSWFYQSYPKRGNYEEGAMDPTLHEGVLEVDAGTQRIVAVARPAQRPDISRSGRELLSNLPANEQYRSADDKATLYATPVQDESRGTLWRWQMIGRDSGVELANLLLPEAYLPWALLEGQFLWHREAVMETVQGQLQDLPARLIALDPKTGIEQWSLAVMSNVYVGPTPP